MDPAPVLALMGGVIAILLAMFVTVLIARRLERKDLPASLTAPADDDKAARARAVRAALTGAFKAHSGIGLLLDAAGKSSEKVSAKKDGEKSAAIAGKKQETRNAARAIAIVGALVALISGVAHVFEKDRSPETIPPVELTVNGLQGTLLDAGKRAEVVLIVPGSGPTDRNGDNPLGMKAQPYKLLAEGLAAKGISSVRVDKRGLFGSAGAGDPNAVSIAIYAEDYRAWIDAIRAQTGRKCIWLLGHSEGALMVSAAAEGRKDVCGLILVSGMGRKMGDVIRQQLQDNPANAPILPEALHAIAELEAGRKVDVTGMHPALLPLFRPQVQDYLISMFAADPVDILRHARKKALIVQGTTDLQTTIEDAKRLDAVPRTRLKLIRGVNHVLKDAPLDRAANIATYANPDLPVDERVIDAIADFIDDDDD
jgi:uncharacterized protein